MRAHWRNLFNAIFIALEPNSDLSSKSLNKTDFGGRGLFAEVFVKFSNEPYYEDGEVKSWDIAPGVGIGRKWLNNKGWTFEIMAGFGRYLISDNEATLKGGISIGKRF